MNDPAVTVIGHAFKDKLGPVAYWRRKQSVQLLTQLTQAVAAGDGSVWELHWK